MPLARWLVSRSSEPPSSVFPKREECLSNPSFSLCLHFCPPCRTPRTFSLMNLRHFLKGRKGQWQQWEPRWWVSRAWFRGSTSPSLPLVPTPSTPARSLRGAGRDAEVPSLCPGAAPLNSTASGAAGLAPCPEAALWVQNRSSEGRLITPGPVAERNVLDNAKQRINPHLYLLWGRPWGISLDQLTRCCVWPCLVLERGALLRS